MSQRAGAPSPSYSSGQPVDRLVTVEEMRGAMLTLGLRQDVVDMIFPMCGDKNEGHDAGLWRHRPAVGYGRIVMQGQYARAQSAK